MNAGSNFDLFDVAEIFKRTPYIAELKPRRGNNVAKDMFEAGGIPLLMKTLLDHGFLHGDCMTVTGRTIAENMEKVAWNPDQDVVWPANKPITATGGVVGLRGSLAPEGAIVKVAGMHEDQLTFKGPALCFDSEGRNVSRLCRSASTRKAAFSSSAMRARAGGQACAKCCRPRPPFTARAWGPRLL